MQYHSMDKNKQNNRTDTQNYYDNTTQYEKGDMAKVVSVVSYLTLIGWLVAIALYGNHKSSATCFHLRQSLGLIITGALLSFIPLVGWLMNIAVCGAWLFALFHAIQGHQQKVPLLGEFYQQHLDFIN